MSLMIDEKFTVVPVLIAGSGIPAFPAIVIPASSAAASTASASGCP